MRIFRLLTTIFILTTAALTHAGFGKLMCVGDSLTDGAGENTRGGGYRVALTNFFDRAHITYTMVGNNATSSGPLHNTDKQWHEGNGGWTTNDVTVGRDGRGCLADWAQQHQPDTVLLLIGQNDPWDWSDAYQKYKALMDSLFAVTPNVKVYWSNVFAEEDHNNYVMTKVTRQDAAIRQLVPYYKAQGRQVVFIDALSYLFNVPGTHDVYGVHLNNYGYDLLGNFYARKMTMGSTGWGGTISPIDVWPWR
ncbi:MAG: hypothetical protein JSS66_06140 [Armatimonadetes bacterium]|nr:hypothetical protein [Armatimonadota bacterium]